MKAHAVPVTILTGFLGAGKSTLLNALLADPAFADTALIINEFGDISIDHDLVKVGQREMMVMTTGCICCTAGSDVRASLYELQEVIAKRFGRAISRVIIETTGLADPAPVVNQLIAGGAPAFGLRDHVVARGFYLAGVVCAVDVTAVETTLDDHFECLKQIAFADRIVFTKSDMAASARRDVTGVVEQLRAINATALIVDRHAPGFDLAAIFAPRDFIPQAQSGDVEGWLALEQILASESRDTAEKPSAGRHAGRIQSFSVIRDDAVSVAELELFLQLLRNAAGPKLLRLKGIVAVAGEPDRPVVVHAVQHSLHPLQQLDAWPSDDHRTRLVLISHDIDPKAVRKLFDVFGGEDKPLPTGRTLALIVALLAMLVGAALVTVALHAPSSSRMSDNTSADRPGWASGSAPAAPCHFDHFPSRDPVRFCKART